MTLASAVPRASVAAAWSVAACSSSSATFSRLLASMIVISWACWASVVILMTCCWAPTRACSRWFSSVSMASCFSDSCCEQLPAELLLLFDGDLPVADRLGDLLRRADLGDQRLNDLDPLRLAVLLQLLLKILLELGPRVARDELAARMVGAAEAAERAGVGQHDFLDDFLVDPRAVGVVVRFVIDDVHLGGLVGHHAELDDAVEHDPEAVLRRKAHVAVLREVEPLAAAIDQLDARDVGIGILGIGFGVERLRFDAALALVGRGQHDRIGILAASSPARLVTTPRKPAGTVTGSCSSMISA